VGQLAPWAKARAAELRGWEDVKLLAVRVDRLSRWFRPGLLCIGDAAHAMSPVGGVGINLAIQDAVAAANALAAPLRAGQLTTDHLRFVQQRREFPTRVTQWLQLMVQRRVIVPVIGKTEPFKPPFVLRLLAGIPYARRIPARLIGIGIRPEHVSAREILSRS
jgi:2-polyprenyl-6-methoxyphenol hydroxylase-like FAD-dependent oxidoreductase